MQVSAIDHVNIVTDDVDATCAFYGDLLGLVRDASPVTGMGGQGAWLRDASGNAIIHLMANGPAMAATIGDHLPGMSTGPIHHVALRCTGFESMKERLAALGTEHRINDRKYGDLRQIFVLDPSNVSLELNFPGD